VLRVAGRQFGSESSQAVSQVSRVIALSARVGAVWASILACSARSSRSQSMRRGNPLRFNWALLHLRSVASQVRSISMTKAHRLVVPSFSV
jgi:hypothetical protein